MAHTELVIDGLRWPSVTEIAGKLDKSDYLVPWAARHGTLKAKAIAEHAAGPEWNEAEWRKLADEIPDSWFKENKVKREDFWKNNEELSADAADKGIRFHENVERVLREQFNLNGDGHLPDDEAAITVGRWADVVGFIPFEFERKVINRKDKYHGTFDCLGRIGGKMVLADWKKTNMIGAAYALQLAGYIGAYAEETGDWIEDARVVRVYELKRPAKKTDAQRTANGWKWSFEGSRMYIEERRYTGMRHHFRLFIYLREIWDYVNKKGMWDYAAVS